ncbi:MAG: hypothetical protein RLZZ282_544, partial [Verrucomicrobiota bacterium]
MNLHGGFAIPPEASGGGMVAFEHGAGIDVWFLAPAEGFESLVECLQAVLDEVVIVEVPCVAGDAKSGRGGHRESAGEIIHGQA